MYYVERSHEPIIDKETFTKVQQELARRAEKFPNTAQKAKEYPFTGLIRCGFCGKYFRRKMTASGTKYAKPVWICPTFNTYGKDICSAQQIPEKNPHRENLRGFGYGGLGSGGPVIVYLRDMGTGA